jgi:hypothetical protein
MAKEPVLNGKKILIPAGAFVAVILAIAMIWGGIVWGSVSDNTEALQEIKQDNAARDVLLQVVQEDVREMNTKLDRIEELLRQKDE